MKNVTTLLIIILNTFVGSCQASNEVYLLIDTTDKMVINEDDLYYYIFDDKKTFERYQYRKKFKPGDPQIFYPTPYCAPLFVANGEAMFIDSKKLKEIDLVNRATFFKRIIEDQTLKLFFVERIDKNHYTIKKVSRPICE